MCRLPQTIEQLLFTCRYVAPLWRIVDSVFGIDVSFETILGVDDFCEYDNIVTLVCFLIFKEWLVLSLENKSRKIIIIIIINLFLLSATSDPSGSALSAVQ